VILGLIILSSIGLAFDSYIDKNDKKLTGVIKDIDYTLNAIFLCECVIKVIALGFFTEPTTYLRDSWNKLDFLVVLVSYAEYLMSSNNDLIYLKVMRMMRILRPLRFISHNRELKFIVIALLESFGGVFNVILIMVLFWIMLAIMGINFLKNKMGYCASSEFSSHYNISK